MDFFGIFWNFPAGYVFRKLLYHKEAIIAYNKQMLVVDLETAAKDSEAEGVKANRRFEHEAGRTIRSNLPDV